MFYKISQFNLGQTIKNTKMMFVNNEFIIYFTFLFAATNAFDTGVIIIGGWEDERKGNDE